MSEQSLTLSILTDNVLKMDFVKTSQRYGLRFSRTELRTLNCCIPGERKNIKWDYYKNFYYDVVTKIKNDYIFLKYNKKSNRKLLQGKFVVNISKKNVCNHGHITYISDEGDIYIYNGWKEKTTKTKKRKRIDNSIKISDTNIYIPIRKSLSNRYFFVRGFIEYIERLNYEYVLYYKYIYEKKKQLYPDKVSKMKNNLQLLEFLIIVKRDRNIRESLFSYF